MHNFVKGGMGGGVAVCKTLHLPLRPFKGIEALPHTKIFESLYPANKASPPDLAIRRRKCDGGGYIVPL